jgi:hypothetical protein
MADMHDEVDRRLDAALAKYAAAEPREGLEGRILANLRAERAQTPHGAWWRWSIAGALAAAIVVALALAWKSGSPSPPVIANHPSEAMPVAEQPRSHGAPEPGEDRGHPPAVHSAIGHSMHHASAPAIATANPKLDQFPSPQPLSEQEKLLQSYVAENPEQAVLVARARMEVMERELKEMKAFPSGDRPADLVRDNDTTER